MKSPLRQLANEHYLGLLDQEAYRQKRREMLDALARGEGTPAADEPVFGGSAATDFVSPPTRPEGMPPMAENGDSPADQSEANLLTQPLMGDPFGDPVPNHDTVAGAPKGDELTRALSGSGAETAPSLGAGPGLSSGLSAELPPRSAPSSGTSLNPMEALTTLDRKIDERERGDGGDRYQRGENRGSGTANADDAPRRGGGKLMKVIVISLLVLAVGVLAAAMIVIS